MFVAMAIRLKCKDQHPRLTVANGVYAHAAIFRAITDEDAGVGRKLHDMRRNKRVTIAIVDSTKEIATLRVTFMAQDGLTYANALINALSSRPVLRLGRTTCAVEAVNLANPNWARISTWSDFTEFENPARRIHFRFVTPTGITKRDDAGSRFISLYPEPLDIFSGLARRWQALDGPALPSDLEKFIRAGGCVVSRHKLHTVEFRTKERTQIGFVGQVVYECRKKEIEYVAALNGLAQLAHFTGVGYQTARGMGAVQVVTSD